MNIATFGADVEPTTLERKRSKCDTLLLELERVHDLGLLGCFEIPEMQTIVRADGHQLTFVDDEEDLDHRELGHMTQADVHAWSTKTVHDNRELSMGERERESGNLHSKRSILGADGKKTLD